MKKTFAALALLLTLLLCTVCLAEETVTSGYCGPKSNPESVSWSYSGGVLTITGSGLIRNYDYTNETDLYIPGHTELLPPDMAPWLKLNINKVVIGEGITGIGTGAFFCREHPAENYSYDNYVEYKLASGTELYLPSTMSSASYSAFWEEAFMDDILWSSPYVRGYLKVHAESMSVADWFNELSWTDAIPVSHLWLDCGLVETLTIPSEITVVNRAFDGVQSIKSVVFHDQVEIIRARAFEGCTGLSSITFGNSPTSIGQNAFDRCTSLTSVTLPSWMDKIPAGMFENCSNLKKVVFPSGIVEIDEYAFFNCSSLTDLQLPDTLGKIGRNSFSGCASLRQLDFPPNLTTLDSAAFSGCTSLTMVVLPDTVETYGSYVFAECGITEATLSFRMSSVPDRMFMDCDNLTNVILNESITKIGDYAFYGCNQLKQIELPSRLTSIGENAFAFSGLTSIDLPDSLVSIGSWAFNGNCFSSVTIPKNVAYIGTFVFANSPTLTSIRYECTSIHLANWTFSGCSQLSEVILPEGTTGIDYQAFEGCTALKQITLPSSITYIGEQAFRNCTALEKVIFIGSAPLVFAEDAMQGVTAEMAYSATNSTWTDDVRKQYGGDLTWVSYDGSTDENQVLSGQFSQNISWTYASADGILTLSGYGPMTLGNQLATIVVPWEYLKFGIKQVVVQEGITSVLGLNDCPNLNSVSLPNSLSIIGGSAFDNSGLTQITLPPNLMEIGHSAFAGSKLKTITIPDSVQTIADWAFVDCTALTSIQLPKGLTIINEGLFSGCSSLQSCILPETVTAIRRRAFYGTENLTSITFPASVREFYESAFSSSGLKTVTFEGNAPTPIPDLWGEPFGGLTLSIYTPEGNDTWTSYLEQDTFLGANVSWNTVRVLKKIVNANITLEADLYVYDGTPKTPAVTVVLDEETLQQDVDYTVQYMENLNAGIASVIITGIGDCEGSQTVNFSISQRDAVLSFAEALLSKQTTDEPFTNPLTAETEGEITYASSAPEVVSVDASTGLVTILTSGEALITASAAESQNYRATEAFYSVVVLQSELPPAITLADLSYSFSNSNQSFGYASNYKIPLDAYMYYFPLNQALNLYAAANVWGGSCFGMAQTSGMMSEEGSGLSLSGFGVTSIADIKVSSQNSQLGVTATKMIERGQISQYLPVVGKAYEANLNNLEGLIKAVELVPSVGKPIMIAVYGTEGGHALLAYNLEKISDTEIHIILYDCNYPHQERYLSIFTNADGKPVSWHYNIQKGIDWGNKHDSKSRITFYPYGTYAAAWHGKENELSMMQVDSANFQIKDPSGSVLASMTNGNFTRHSNSVLRYIPLEMGKTSSTTTLYLPTNVYEVVNTSGASMSVTMIDKQQSASVTTDADGVLMAVLDNAQMNEVYVMGDSGSSYSVTLNSSLASSEGMEEVKFTGYTGNAVVQLGVTGGQINMVNCPGVSLWINNEMLVSPDETTRRNVADCSISLSYNRIGYDGKRKEPVVSVYNGTYPLVQDTDFVVVYRNNTEIGTAIAAVYGIGSYGGQAFIDFDIVKADESSCIDGHTWDQGKEVTGDDGLITVVYTCLVCGKTSSDSTGDLVYRLVSASKKDVTVRMISNRADRLEALLCLVISDAQGNAVSSAVKSIALNTAEAAELTVSIAHTSAGKTIKAFILDSATYAPLSDAWSIPLN